MLNTQLTSSNCYFRSTNIDENKTLNIKKQTVITCVNKCLFSSQFNFILFAIKVLRFEVLIEKVIAK